MDFGALPPEINSGRMYAGSGAGPMMAAAAAWSAVATGLESAARGYSSVISGLQGEAWSGGASVAMADAVAPYVAWVTTTAAQAEQAANQARAAAAAYETAFAAVVPPALVTANRAQLANLAATNIFGQNATQIAATEAAYGEMWAQDAHAMYSYAASSAAATKFALFSDPPQTTNPTGQSGQATAVAQATASSTASHSQITFSGLMTAVPQQLQTLSAAGTSGSSTSSSSSMLTAFSDFNTLTAPANLFSGLSRTYTSAGSFGTGLFRSNVQGSGHLPEAATQAVTVGAKTLASEGVSGPVLVNVGRGASVGGLSVPQTWASATPVASASEEPLWLSEMDLGAVPPATETTGTATVGGAPIAGMGPLAGMLARPSVSSVLRVEPRRFKMPRPPVGG